VAPFLYIANLLKNLRQAFRQQHGESPGKAPLQTLQGLEIYIVWTNTRGGVWGITLLGVSGIPQFLNSANFFQIFNAQVLLWFSKFLCSTVYLLPAIFFSMKNLCHKWTKGYMNSICDNVKKEP